MGLVGRHKPVELRKRVLAKSQCPGLQGSRGFRQTVRLQLYVEAGPGRAKGLGRKHAQHVVGAELTHDAGSTEERPTREDFISTGRGGAGDVYFHWSMTLHEC